MWIYEKKLQHPVKIARPNPRLAGVIITALGGPDGELGASMRYLNQRYTMPDDRVIGILTDVGSEELGHMEMIAQTINLLNGHDVDSESVSSGEIQSHVILGLNPGLINASGYSWTAVYVTVTGDLCADLLSNIASEQRAKVVYEYLYRQIDDKKVRETA